jgi:hypothetical protein
MRPLVQMWGEMLFSPTYLVVIWALVIVMIRRYPKLEHENRKLAWLFTCAFALLAIGDTGHVGVRVLAYAIGDMEKTFRVMDVEFGLVGTGALLTSVTVTLFYVIMTFVWKERFGKPYGWFAKLLFSAAAVRLGMMLLSQNEWNRVVSPYPWAIYRNLPLIVQGIGVAYLIIRDAEEMGDKVFKWIGLFILLSYSFLVPVILLVERVPVLGMLMIPKTLAYLVIAWLGYVELFRVTTLKESRSVA